MPFVRIIKPGPLCTIQDLGRTGGGREGVSPGGAMDRHAFLWANHLLGNAPQAAALEITLGGLTVEFEQPTTIAITGSECDPVVDGQSVDEWRTVQVAAGQRLRFGVPRKGLRAYLAVPGGFQTETFFGSASTVLREGLPGQLGSALASGDTLKWTGKVGPNTSSRIVPPQYTALPGPTLTLPFLPGFEWEAFSGHDRRQLMAADWRVDAESDRVCIRLSGPPVESGPEILDSTPIVDGTIQVLPSGQPLIFMRDRPTMGGYPKMGAVLPDALNRLAQAQPGTRIQFRLGDAAEARAAMVRADKFFGLRYS